MKESTRRALEEKKRLDELAKWLADRAWLTPDDVAEHVGVSRRTVERLPFEVLPYMDLTPESQRSVRRYSPDDVAVLPEMLREYNRAKAEGREDVWLEERAEGLRERDRAAINAA